MSETQSSSITRRQLLKDSGRVAAATAVVGMALPKAFAADDPTIQIALVGCGGRGTGAAVNAMSSPNGPVKLVAMADVFDSKMDRSYTSLSKKMGDQVDVPPEKRFIGFDGYKKAMDCLRPGDIVILATPPAFRWVHFAYAVEKNLNVFMEKPVAVDGPAGRKMLEIGKKADAKGLKVAVGLMCRHCRARGELFERIKDGQIGDLTLLRAYRVTGPTGSAFSKKKPEGENELMWQISRFHSWLWLSGGGFSDFLIHNIDECCWMKDAWPVEAKGYGGRHYRGDCVDQNFDSYTVEYTFADGAKLMLEGRGMTGCDQEFASYAHGTKGSAIISTSAHMPSKARMFKNQDQVNENITWAWEGKEPNPYQMEWDDLLEAIKADKRYSELERGVMASMVTSLGRMACHTGQKLTFDDLYNCEHEFAPNVDKLTMDGPSPLKADEEGFYPVPMPGVYKKTEYRPQT